jgi:hypothetical protein
MNMTKNIFTLFRIVSVVAIGFIALGLYVNGAEARVKSGVKASDTSGRTASSYRKPLKPFGSGHHRRGRSVPKETGGMPVNNGGLKSQPLQ